MKRVLFTSRSKIKSVSNTEVLLPVLFSDLSEYNRVCLNQQVMSSVFRTKNDRNKSVDRIRHQQLTMSQMQYETSQPKPLKKIQSVPLSPSESSNNLRNNCFYSNQIQQRLSVDEKQNINMQDPNEQKINQISKTENDESSSAKQYVQRSRSTFICKAPNYRSLVDQITQTHRPSHQQMMTEPSTSSSFTNQGNQSIKQYYSKVVKPENQLIERLDEQLLNRRQTRQQVIVSSSIGNFSEYKSSKRVKTEAISIQSSSPLIPVKENNFWNFEVNLNNSNRKSQSPEKQSRQPSRHLLKSRDACSRRESIERIFDQVVERQPQKQINSITVEGNSVLKTNEIMNGMKHFSNKLIISSVVLSQKQQQKKVNSQKYPVFGLRNSLDDSSFIPPNVLCSNSMNKRNKSTLKIQKNSVSPPQKQRSNSVLGSPALEKQNRLGTEINEEIKIKRKPISNYLKPSIYIVNHS